MRYKVHTVWLAKSEDFQKLMEEINEVEFGLETAESTYEEIKDGRNK